MRVAKLRGDGAGAGSGTGRLGMLPTDYGAPVPASTAGGLSASTDQAFSAVSALTLVLARVS